MYETSAVPIIIGFLKRTIHSRTNIGTILLLRLSNILNLESKPKWIFLIFVLYLYFTF